MKRTLEVCDIVYYGLDSFGRERQRWRVSGHLKRVEDNFGEVPICQDSIENEILTDVLSSILLREKLEREEKGLPHTRRFRYEYCCPEEATHVSLVSVGGAIAPIGECEFIEVVKWSPKLIAQEKAGALAMISHFNLRREWQWE